MKQLFALSLISLLGVTSALAGYSERKLETAKNSAARSGKKIAFVFNQDYYDPNCPKCVAAVSANNAAVKKALPRADVVIIEIEKGDKDMDKLPTCVPSTGTLPRVVVTDAACEKVVADLQGAPDRDKAKAFEEKVKGQATE